MQFSQAYFYLISLKAHIVSSASWLIIALSIYYYLNVRDHFSHPHETASKISFCILFFYTVLYNI
jgi:hypothetical protein